MGGTVNNALYWVTTPGYPLVIFAAILIMATGFTWLATDYIDNKESHHERHR